jgi:hypothetical protein
MNNNKDRYQRSFNTLHLSDDFREKIMENPEDNGKGKIMNFRAMHGISRVAAAVVTVCTVAIGSAGVCYANDIGGIRTTLQMWINGNSQEVEVIQTGESSYAVYNENGEETMGFGGLSFDEDGNEIPMSAEELAGYMNNDCYLEITEDGRYIFSYKNLTEDVTDQLDKNGNLYIHVEDPANEYTYFNITDITDHGYSVESGCRGSFGKDYYEVDSTGLASTEANQRQNDENTAYSTTVMSDED